MDAGPRLLVPRQNNGEPGLRRSARERVGRLFVTDHARGGRARRAYWAALAVPLGALISLARVPGGPGVLNTIWAEDGSDFLTDALNHNPYGVIGRPHNGYFVVVPRLLAIPASRVPIEWGPAVLTAEAAVVTALMALGVYVASRSYLRHRLARLVAAVPVLAVPVGENVAAAASNNVATLQFAAVYLALWMVLWVPARRGGRIVAAAAVLAVCASTFLAVVLLPLAALRLYARRDATSAVMTAGLFGGLVANVVALSLHVTARPVILPPRYDPLWALSMVVEWALPHALFGYGVTGAGDQRVDPRWLVWAALPVVCLVVLVAALRITRPQWRVAAVFGVVGVALLCGSVMQYGGIELRYVVAPELMLFAALVALLLPRPDGRRAVAWAPLIALSLSVGLVVAASYRTPGPRTALASWTGSVERARTACRDLNNRAVYIFPADGDVLGWPSHLPNRTTPPPGFGVFVPCDRLR